MHRGSDSSDSEDDALFSSGAEDDAEAVSVTPKSGKRKAREDEGRGQAIIVQTAFDAYFTHSSSRPADICQRFFFLIPPLSSTEYAEAIANLPDQQLISVLLTDSKARNALFIRILRELKEGFNVLCYGYGSKRKLLNQFAVERCSKAGHVVVANGFQPNFSIKDLLNSIEAIPGILSLPASSTAIESQARRISTFFSQPSQKRSLYIIIHNIDSPSLRTTKSKACLALLASNPRVHIVASVDHINAPLIWSSSEASSRGDGGFTWLWHDMTTLAPYDFELAYADRSSISGAHGGGSRKQRDAGGSGAANTTNMSETAAAHVLASVTQKAKKLFVLMAKKQLDAVEEAGGPPGNDMQPFAIGYGMLFNAARDEFIATNDTALRSLLGEFRDHNLILGEQSTSGTEMLWIPLRKERLANVLHSIQVE
ncbi:origin recognition complex subunit 2-domain-containing protein [Desarmillaria tabescens]|uniref:Origin recognition complex subunit 2 n=1 Tax=Armillaria tabescens TaxID=1929756 RepID=A0AA39NLN2_ARMTA|nr:origin recognition complex subunit 2-domain-containing protein [Desarmillaria tabescens]KAK0467928.1 origin recognition complex subunit 2-domain-containing protein [Desarmillaria tabescens]